MSDIPIELSQLACMHLRQTKGIEMVPDEVHDIGAKALETVRAKLREKGFDVPESNIEFLQQINEIEKKHQQEQAMLDRVWKKIKAKIDSDVVQKKPYSVTHSGSVVLRFETSDEAHADCTERNRRAKTWGLKARYRVRREAMT